MTKTQAKQIIKNDLTPKYEASRDSVINYVISKAVEYREVRARMNIAKQTIDGKESKEWRELYIKLYGFYNKETKKEEQGTIYNGVAKKYQGMMHQTDKNIIKHYTAEYKQIIKELVEAIYNDIKIFNQKAIEAGASEHDINFKLTTKDGKQQSYTINTIIAGGYIQVIHNRTLRKLHKGVI